MKWVIYSRPGRFGFAVYSPAPCPPDKGDMGVFCWGVSSRADKGGLRSAFLTAPVSDKKTENYPIKFLIFIRGAGS